MKTFSKAYKFGAILLSIALVAALIVLAVRNARNSSDENTLKVGMECAYAPFNWIQPTAKNGAIKISGGWYACGYDVYIAEEIAKKMGKKLEIIKIDWDGLLPALTSGKIDAIIAGMSATKERKQAIDFTDNYYASNIVIVLKKSSPYAGAKSLSDFKGAKITGQLSTVHYTLIDQIPGVIKEVPMEDFSSMISAVNAGKIDGYISEKPAALAAVRTNPTLTYAELEKGKGFSYSQDDVAIAIGVKKGSSLKDKINSALSIVDEKRRDELMEKAVMASGI